MHKIDAQNSLSVEAVDPMITITRADHPCAPAVGDDSIDQILRHTHMMLLYFTSLPAFHSELPYMSMQTPETIIAVK